MAVFDATTCNRMNTDKYKKNGTFSHSRDEFGRCERPKLLLRGVTAGETFRCAEARERLREIQHSTN
jgi:hypothetical protein